MRILIVFVIAFLSVRSFANTHVCGVFFTPNYAIFPAERLEFAERLLGRVLTISQQKAILAAPTRVSPLKLVLLSQAGFNRAEVSLLLEAGVVESK